MLSLNFMRSTLAVLTLSVSSLLIAGCKAGGSPTEQADLAQPSPESPAEQDALVQNNIERYDFDGLITLIFEDYPIIAIVQDENIRYPESEFNNPPDEIFMSLKLF